MILELKNKAIQLAELRVKRDNHRAYCEEQDRKEEEEGQW